MKFSPCLVMVLLVCCVSCIVEGNEDPRAVVRHPKQLILEPEEEMCVLQLDGSRSKYADAYEWSTVEKPEEVGEVTIDDRDSALASTTLRPGRGSYVFRLEIRNETSSKTSTANSTVLVTDPAAIGMHNLATTIVQKLIEMRYKYLYMSQRFMRADSYFPNVAGLFRSLSTDRQSMLEEVMDYIIDKQATVDLMSSCPPNFVRDMMEQGLRERFDIKTKDLKKRMESSFKVAIGDETTLATDLATVAHHADENLDYELSQFTAADLIPRVTKVINQLSNHYHSVLKRAGEDRRRHLVEFLFDRNLK